VSRTKKRRKRVNENIEGEEYFMRLLGEVENKVLRGGQRRDEEKGGGEGRKKR